MAISGAKYFSVQAQGGALIAVYQIIPEGSSYNKEPNLEKECNGNQVLNGFNCSLEIVSADLGKFTQLEAWMKSKNNVSVIVYGFSEDIYWNEYTTFIVKRNYKTKFGQRNTFTIRMQFKGETNNIRVSSHYVTPPIQQ